MAHKGPSKKSKYGTVPKMRHSKNLVTVKVHREGSGEAATAAASVQNAFAKAFDLGKKIGEGFLL